MKDEDKSKKQLLAELKTLRERLGESQRLETERKRAEEVLQKSEKRYRLFAENVTDVIWTLDMNLRYTYVSPSVTRLMGYSVEEVTGQTIEDVLTPASLEVARGVFRESLVRGCTSQERQNKSDTLELELKCKDGSTVWTEVKMTFLRDPDGRPYEILGVTRDISERRRAEEILRESEQMYHSLFENAPLGVGIADADGNLIAFNDAMLKPGDYTREDIAKIKNVLELYHDSNERSEIMGMAREQGFIHQREVRFKRKDGAP